MSFLGMGTFEILIVLLVAFIFLGPERMIDAARTLGKWTGELRRMGSTVQAEMDDLTNVGSPLTSRYEQGQSARDTAANTQPLDQDHPSDEFEPAGSKKRRPGAVKASDGVPEDVIASPKPETEPARKEEGA